MSDKEREYIFFLEDIQTALAKIEKYTEGLSFEEFCNFEMAVDAVLRNLEVIGEAVKNIPEGVRNRYHEVEWKEAVGFRNVLAHDCKSNRRTNAVHAQHERHAFALYLR